MSQENESLRRMMSFVMNAMCCSAPFRFDESLKRQESPRGEPGGRKLSGASSSEGSSISSDERLRDLVTPTDSLLDTPPESPSARTIDDSGDDEETWPETSSGERVIIPEHKTVYDCGELYLRSKAMQPESEPLRGFFDGMRSHFHGALPLPSFLDDLSAKLMSHDFSKLNAALVVVRCREKSMLPFVEELVKDWKTFKRRKPNVHEVTAPAGIASFDYENLIARPVKMFGMRKIVYLVASHITLGQNGELGRREDRLTKEVETCCGDLYRVLHEKGPQNPTSSEAWDEYRRVHRKLKPELQKQPSLAELTKRVNRDMCNSLMHGLQKLLQGRDFSFTVIGVVIVHAPNGGMYTYKTTAALWNAEVAAIDIAPKTSAAALSPSSREVAKPARADVSKGPSLVISGQAQPS